MNEPTKNYYIIQYSPDDEGVPHFMDKTWTPALPGYDIYTAPPHQNDFAKKYALKAKSYQLNGDYLLNDNLVSHEFIELCNSLNVNFFYIPTDVQLLRSKVPSKEYYLFFLLDYLSILDQNKSIFTISKDINSGKLNTPEDKGLNKTYYDAIDLFHIKDDVSKHLFFCQEISQPVCSQEFKVKFESLGLKGIEFILIDDNYKYDAWEGW
ncbi:imm11 family protein [Enterobacillus tribolii]|uniref:Immunity MXAN-0049 protein domain-containing protein n=1 Tax=Enterobacillus tribolii TaxID=1487935 RepID=A0A370QRY7_9GAMM|nr:DUF1629 domain-containing protein [Enterobacillus tribolii]MBW7983483.1 hypothetical protein [Enterobacillus tribolii]RDK92022.1 hypothetical protein C8D90_104174 [Enterobacillus tribolii]